MSSSPNEVPQWTQGGEGIINLAAEGDDNDVIHVGLNSFGRPQLQSFTSLDSEFQTSLSSPQSERSFWEKASAMEDDQSETASTVTSRSQSHLSLADSDAPIRPARTKRKRRNRVVDIDEIIIDFDPEKEFLWQMRQKYERDKHKRRLLQHSKSSSLPSITSDNDETVIVIDESNPDAMTDTTMMRNGPSSSVSPFTRTISVKMDLDQPTLSPDHSNSDSSIGNARENGSNHAIGRGRNVSVINKTPRQMPHQLSRDYSIDSIFSTSESANSLVIPSDGAESPTAVPDYEDTIEVLVIHRLPGEKLGMGLSVESTGGDNDPVKGVFVESVEPGGAADKATGGSRGICVGDQILEINGTPLQEVSYVETVSFFSEMPLRVIMMVRRSYRPMSKRLCSNAQSDSSSHSLQSDASVLQSQGTKSSKHMSSNGATGEDQRTLSVITLSFTKAPTDGLGIALVPTQGTIPQYYKVHVLHTFTIHNDVAFHLL